MKLTAQQILELPELTVGYRELKCADGKTIRIPTWPEEKCMYVGADSIICAIDGNLDRWVPVETNEGMRRKRL